MRNLMGMIAAASLGMATESFRRSEPTHTPTSRDSEQRDIEKAEEKRRRRAERNKQQQER